MLSKDVVSVKSNLSLTPHRALGVNSPVLISLEVSRPGSYAPAPISPCPPLENRGQGMGEGEISSQKVLVDKGISF